MKAVILAGGLGKRLRPLTEELPKPLILVHGKPIIVHQIEWLRSHGIEEFIVCAGYLKEKFLETLGEGGRYGVHIAYVVEEEPLGTGGALKNTEHILKNESTIYVLNGDILTNIDPMRLLSSMEKDIVGAIAVIPLPSRFGIVKFEEDGRVLSFVEKPSLEGYWINAGVYLFSPEIFDDLPVKGDIEKTTFPKLARKGLLRAVKYSGGYWKSIDSFKDLEEAEIILAEAEIR